MLAVEGLSKAWPGFGLEVDLGIGNREIAAILGPSGCGKSTLLRLLAGLERADAGRIIVDGEDVSGLPPERRGIGLVFQDFALFPSLSVRRNIEYGPRMKGMPRAERAREAEALAAAFEIGRLLDRNPASLSGGEQQRVALARTLAAGPRLVLLDEPLSSLDAGLRRRLRSEIAERLRAAGLMALHVTHDVEEALAMADKVFLMGQGRIVESGSPEELYANPATAYGARFLGRGPVLPIARLESADGRCRALTALGSFLCESEPRVERGPSREPASEVAGGDRDSLSLFFPADAVRPLGGSGIEGKDNTFSGRVIDSSFAGRFRRIRISCEARGEGKEEAGMGGRIEVEVEVAASLKPHVGEAMTFLVPPPVCRFLR